MEVNAGLLAQLEEAQKKLHSTIETRQNAETIVFAAEVEHSRLLHIIEHIPQSRLLGNPKTAELSMVQVASIAAKIEVDRAKAILLDAQIAERKAMDEVKKLDAAVSRNKARVEELRRLEQELRGKARKMHEANLRREQEERESQEVLDWLRELALRDEERQRRKQQEQEERERQEVRDRLRELALENQERRRRLQVPKQERREAERVEAWYKSTEDAFTTYSELRVFPTPPALHRCVENKCQEQRDGALGICHCDLRAVFTRHKDLHPEFDLKKERIRWHPDRFSACDAVFRDDFQRKAKEVFTCLGNMYDEEEVKNSGRA